MSDSVRCPKCNSDQITAQKRGFSGGKAVAGAVLTGGVGALAGFHGIDKLDIYCLACGHKWDPAERAQQAKRKVQQAQMKRIRQSMANDRIWKNQFFRAYESGNMNEAENIIRQNLAKLINNRGLDESYRVLKRLDRISTAMKLLFLALFIALVLWIAS